jgi:hypothetical protein
MLKLLNFQVEINGILFVIFVHMQFLLFILYLFTTPVVDSNCTYDNIQLHGRIQYVDSFEDIRVKIVDEFAYIDVKLVSEQPDECGEWQIVDDLPDLRVKIVESGEDIKIRFVDEFSGKN